MVNSGFLACAPGRSSWPGQQMDESIENARGMLKTIVVGHDSFQAPKQGMNSKETRVLDALHTVTFQRILLNWTCLLNGYLKMSISNPR